MRRPTKTTTTHRRRRRRTWSRATRTRRRPTSARTARKTSCSCCAKGLANLDQRSRDIIARRWLDADSKVTLQELADEYGVSAERIRQIEANALKKMKALFTA